MSTISKNVGRGDFELHRGSDETIGVRWTETDPFIGSETPKDLVRWTATLSLIGLDETSPWYTTGCTTTRLGYAYAEIEAAALRNAPQRYERGQWRIDATSPDGAHELLGWGYYTLV